MAELCLFRMCTFAFHQLPLGIVRLLHTTPGPRQVHRTSGGQRCSQRKLRRRDQAMWCFTPSLLGCPADCFAEELVLTNSTE